MDKDISRQLMVLVMVAASLVATLTRGLANVDGRDHAVPAVAQQSGAAAGSIQPGALPQTPEKGKDAPQAPKNLEPLGKHDTLSVLGKKVQGPAGENMGRVVDLLFDRRAQPRAVVIDFGGFLGVGIRKIAIDWRLVRFVPQNPDAPIALTLSKAEIQVAPEYKASSVLPVMVGPPHPDAHAIR
jgi:hypothetical protein